MRFLQLDLRDYGPFQNAEPIRLDGGSRGLHLILGPNEAGKSTALRAIRTLLFGFPKSTGDNHGRDYATLRLGAILQGEQGEERAFVRRKRDVKPLWDFDDAAPIAPDALVPFLGGLDEEKYRDLFSMDHDELIAGGRSILTGGGRLGEMLFAAGSGLAPVAEVRKGLDEEMDRLFRPRASTPSINAALVELAERRRDVEKRMLATSAWEELDGEIARLRVRLAEVEAERPRLVSEKRRLERLRKALPKAARRRDAAGELERRRHVPVLSEGFAELRRAESIALELASKQGRDSAAALEEIGRELDELGPPDPVLAEADAIGRLQLDLGVYLKEARERPALEAKLAAIEANARSRMASFPEGFIADPGRLRSILAGRDSIQELAQQLGLLEASCRQAEADVDRLLDPLGRLVDGPDLTEAARLAESLGEAVARVVGLGDLDRQLAEGRAEREQAVREADLTLRSLGLWSGSLEELEALAVPSPATIDRFEAEFRGFDEAIGRIEASLAQLETDRLAIERDLDVARLSGPVPTEEELDARRKARADSWRLVRPAWLDGRVVDDPSALADRFEGEIRSADELADRLRREADRVAARAQGEAARRNLLARIAALVEELGRHRDAKAAALDAWKAAWRPLGIDPLPPREMRDWVVIDRPALLQKAAEIRKATARLDGLARRIDEHRAELGRGLARLGEPPVDPLDPLAAFLDRARAAIARVARALDLGEARSARSKAEAALSAWKSRWAEAVEPLGLGVDASPSRANAALAEVDALIKAVDDLAALRESIDDGLRRERRFREGVEALADRLGLDRPVVDVEAASIAIKAKLDRSREAKARREGLLKREADERAKLASARLEADRAGLALGALVREARCETHDGLPDAERASDEVKSLRKELRDLDEWLADAADGDSVAWLLNEAERSDADSLDVRIAELADRLEPLEAGRDQLLEEIGRRGEQLQRMDGGPAAAEARQELEDRVARLALDVENYARLRLASAVLRDAVERYRKEHQGPVLDRAGALFAGLTAGSFAGLRADVDAKGQPILLGVRKDGSTTLDVEAMSEGTADQLYLALRLASLHAHLDAGHEPMPLVVDDLLVNFDDARALAALEALADLSGRTQVLFFTHHAHLVALARSALPESVLFVHHLAYPPVALNGHAGAEAAVVEKPKRKKKAATSADD